MPKDKSWDELAGKIGVSVRNIHRWKHIPGAPSTTDAAAWKLWMANNGKGETAKQRSAAFVMPNGVELPGSCSYDRAIAKGYPAPEALRREQIREQELKNAKLEIEIEKTKSNIYTADDVREHDAVWNTAVANEAEKVQRLIDGIDGVAPEQRKVFLDRFRDWRKSMSLALSKVSL